MTLKTQIANTKLTPLTLPSDDAQGRPERTRAEQRTILILYYTRGVYPLRDTIKTHLYCWKRYSQHRTAYVNIALGFPWRFIEEMAPDIIILHTSLCGMRWGDDVFAKFAPLLAPLKDCDARIIALPQDEFIHTDKLCELLTLTGTNVVLSCAGAEAWPIIYGDLAKRLEFRQVLTGYLDEQTVATAEAAHRPLSDRDKWIGYRAWRAADWLGRLGTLKVRVGEVFADAAHERELTVDISLDSVDTIAGNDWLKWLAGCRAVVGVEGGASVLDRDGSLKATVEAYRASFPKASFDDVEAACFPGRDGELPLRALSPRHLEAAATRTVQVLVEGDYNGILQADVHYIPVREDFSDIDAAFDRLADDSVVTKMLDRAWDDLVASERYSFAGFVAGIEAAFIDEAPKVGPPPTRRIRTLNWRDRWNWRFIATEVRDLANPSAKSQRRTRLRNRLMNRFSDIP